MGRLKKINKIIERGERGDRKTPSLSFTDKFIISLEFDIPKSLSMSGRTKIDFTRLAGNQGYIRLSQKARDMLYKMCDCKDKREFDKWLSEEITSFNDSIMNKIKLKTKSKGNSWFSEMFVKMIEEEDKKEVLQNVERR
jgi:hypothetical protein